MSIPELRAQQKAFFDKDRTRSYTFRNEQLTKLAQAIDAFSEDLYHAFWQDLHKPAVEVYSTEIGFVLSSIHKTKKQLRRWMKPKKARNPLFLLGSESYSLFEPYGTVLIIGPYNYPFQLLIEPLVGAIAAGNTVVLKPSELTPHVADVLKRMIESVFDPAYVAVVEGGVDETTQLLAQRFDHIFFTGSPRVGKIVMQAASTHLTPVTLELGGKSPAIIAADAPVKKIAEKLAWGKFLNTGQTCVAPDYVLIDQRIASEFITHFVQAIATFYGHDPETSLDYGRLATVSQTARLVDLLKRTDGKVVLGGDADIDQRYLAPTVVTDVSWQDALMQEELFGPVLPIISYDPVQFETEVIQAIRQKEKPLALYLFTKDPVIIERVTSSLSFGGGVINDALLHLSNPNLPFGGVGQSGMGHYHGKYSFETFSHQKALLKKKKWPSLSLLYPPYTDKTFRLIKKIMK